MTTTRKTQHKTQRRKPNKKQQKAEHKSNSGRKGGSTKAVAGKPKITDQNTAYQNIRKIKRAKYKDKKNRNSKI